MLENYKQPEDPQPRLEKTPETTLEKIVSAAIIYQGQVFTGPTHAAAIQKIEQSGVQFNSEQYAQDESMDAFVTSDGRLVDRSEANRIALATEQIKNSQQFPGELFSEDMR